MKREIRKMWKVIGELRHLFATVFMAEMAIFMVIPVMTDVTMEALCPGQDECSLAIYLSGFQQAITGFGAVVITPIMGSLSDHYGRKAMLTIPLTFSILPLAILAYSRDTNFFYAYFGVKTIVAMVSDATIHCIALAYVWVSAVGRSGLERMYPGSNPTSAEKTTACGGRYVSPVINPLRLVWVCWLSLALWMADNITEEGRASAFGVLSGIIMSSFVLATIIARFLPTPLTFQVATFMSMAGVLYMRIFLKDKNHTQINGDLTQPILKNNENGNKILPSPKRIPRFGDVICLLKSSVTFSQLAVVAFFLGLSDGGLQSSALFYWKALFHFTKNQYANLFLLFGAAGMIAQLILMPLLAAHIREEKLLSLGLFMSFINMFVNSIAWAEWVPYASTVFAALSYLGPPSLRSIVSKQIGPNDQGKAQGCISSISSAATIISPLIFSPLTAMFLSEEAPFNFPGFSMLCIGFASIIAFIQSVMIKPKLAPTLINTMEVA